MINLYDSGERVEICKYTFIRKIIDLWLRHGNVYNPALGKAWMLIRDMLEEQMNGSSGVYVTDAVCGTGKTLAIQCAAATICKTQPSCGVLIVVRFTDQADEIATQINGLAGRDVACAFHSKPNGRRTQEEIYQAQVLVITHSAYIHSIQKGGNTHLYWQRGQRKLRVIDEALDIITRYSISGKLTSFLLSALHGTGHYHRLKATYPKELELLETMGRLCEESTTTNVEGYRGRLFSDLAQEFDGVKLTTIWPELQRLPSQSWSLSKGMDLSELLQLIHERLHAIDTALLLEIWSSTRPEHCWNAAELILPDNFPSIAITDATSNIDGIYRLFPKEKIYRYSVSRSVRDFSNAKLYVRPERAGLGKETSNKKAKNRLPKILNWCQQRFSAEDRVLFAAHKETAETLKLLIQQRELPFEADVIWWKNIDGRNDFSHYNKLVVLSIPYPPTYFSPTAAMAFSRHELTQDQDFTKDLTNSSIAVQLVQLLCRINVRRVIDDQGNCPEAEIYLLLPGDAKDQTLLGPDHVSSMLTLQGQALLRSITSSLSNINLTGWNSFPGFDEASKGRPSHWSESFLIWLSRLNTGEEVDLKAFDSNLREGERRSLKRMLADQNSRITHQLNSLGIRVLSKKGRGGYTKLYRFSCP
jgi:hypothetical protein